MRAVTVIAYVQRNIPLRPTPATDGCPSRRPPGPAKLILLGAVGGAHQFYSRDQEGRNSLDEPESPHAIRTPEIPQSGNLQETRHSRSDPGVVCRRTRHILHLLARARRQGETNTEQSSSQNRAVRCARPPHGV